MKRVFFFFFFSLLLFSCSKQTRFNRPATLASELQVQANDAIRVSGEIDALINDVDSVLGGGASVCGGDTTMTVDTVNKINYIVLSYTGKSCDASRGRTGTVTLGHSTGGNWNLANDSVTIQFTNVVIRRAADTLNMTVGGSLLYRNLSGGSLAGLKTAGAAPVVHTLAGYTIMITFDNGFQTRWNFARQRSYSYNGGLLISTIGLDSAGTTGGVADWGANRYGNSMYVAPTSALVISQSCGWRLTGGQATLTNPAGLSALHFGLDSTGTATGCPINGGKYYYKLAWTADGEKPYSALVAY